MATRLHVNVDHFATIRQQRHTSYPDPVAAAALAELAGAQGITVHLREDRRHIQDRDVRLLRQTVQTRLNLEMAMTDEMQQIALEVLPDIVTLVPERREELTTEGGLDVVGLQESLQSFLAPLSAAGMECALFIDPNPAQIKAARELNVPLVELSTASYCEAPFGKERQRELQRLREMAALAHSLGLEVAAGHGLDYTQVAEVAEIPEIVELNIGHSMVARASLVGLERAVKEMLVLLGQTTA